MEWLTLYLYRLLLVLPFCGNNIRETAAKNRSAVRYLTEYSQYLDKLFISGGFIRHRIVDKAWDDLRHLIDSKVPIIRLGLSAEEIMVLRKAQERLKHLNETRKAHNKAFVGKESTELSRLLPDAIFSPSQMEAVLTLDDTCVVVAGAGSGKTRVITARVEYLIKRKLALPEEIIVLSFNKKAADEICERLAARGIDGVEVSTLHSQGLKICETLITPAPRKGPFLDENKRSYFFRNWIQEAMSDEDLSKHIALWVTEYRYPRVDGSKFKSLSEFYQSIPKNGYRTIVGERVRSHQEQRIADALFLLGIKYEYEPYYKDSRGIEDRRYRPDFYLPEHNLYLEHFGISRDGSTAPFIDSVKYNSDIDLKRKRHEKEGSKLIETYSYELNENDVFSVIEGKLASFGIPVIPRPFNELRKDTFFAKAVSRFANLLGSFLSLAKANRIDQHVLRDRLNEHKGDQKRLEAFLRVYVKLHLDYESAKDGLDFADMINMAADYLSASKEAFAWRHIIVDEFQDITKASFALVEGLLKQQKDSMLLAVGDDWQSIYRFGGADIKIMKELFEKEATSSVQIQETFRMNKSLTVIASNFVTKNPNQIKKSVASLKDGTHSSTFHFIQSKMPYEGDKLLNYLKKIDKATGGHKSVLILTRYVDDETSLGRLLSSVNLRKTTVSSSTIHKAKGLEADHVAIVGLEDDFCGFPNFIEEDPVLSAVLSTSDTYELAEERRLFYVAMTRAKETVTLFYDDDNPSRFIVELSKDLGAKFALHTGEVSVPCPECKGLSMRITRPAAGQRSRLRCVNAPLCKGYMELCPSCKSGGLVGLKGKYRCNQDACGKVFEYSKVKKGYVPKA
jgi:DNA helicase IV